MQTITAEKLFTQAIREAIDECMAKDPSVYVMGLGVPDPKGIFGTTAGLQAKYGDGRVFDTPTSENGMTGVAIGSAIMGMRPILVHQRLDFALLSIEQIVNQAAKWRFMFGGQSPVPIVIRMMVGRGWGQGPQHSQSLQSWFAHVPGLKVVMPSRPHDAKGLLVSSIEDDDPVIFIEHRWLHGVSGPVPDGLYREPLGKARVARSGRDVTLVGISYMTLESLRAADLLAELGVEAEVVDVRTLAPLDEATIVDSVRKTHRVVIADTGWRFAGFGAEIVATITESAFEHLTAPPVRIALPDYPTPTTPGLTAEYYPRAADIAAQALRLLGREHDARALRAAWPVGDRHDVPDPNFTGPF